MLARVTSFRDVRHGDLPMNCKSSRRATHVAKSALSHVIGLINARNAPPSQLHQTVGQRQATFSGHYGRRGVDIPGPQFLDAADGWSAMRVSTSRRWASGSRSLSFADQAVDGRHTFAARIRSGKQIVLPPRANPRKDHSAAECRVPDYAASQRIERGGSVLRLCRRGITW
jgi:hypothetical protein